MQAAGHVWIRYWEAAALALPDTRRRQSFVFTWKDLISAFVDLGPV